MVAYRSNSPRAVRADVMSGSVLACKSAAMSRSAFTTASDSLSTPTVWLMPSESEANSVVLRTSTSTSRSPFVIRPSWRFIVRTLRTTTSLRTA